MTKLTLTGCAEPTVCNTLSLSDALQIVYDLAMEMHRRNVGNGIASPELIEHEDALNVVHDYIVNQHGID
jgi:hypothetical protein